MREKEAIRTFRNAVWAHYKKHGRHTLPWRKTEDPYRILVSEVMLQQTQVERVIPFYTAWMKKFPTARALSAASLSKVLKAWQGLGYNRRAKNLHAAAKAIVQLRAFPRTPKELEALPGIGPYTARAVSAFALNQDVVFIETNIRTVFMHHFFPGKAKVADKDLVPLLEAALPKGRAREWYSALMDYGSYLKRSGVRLNARTKGYKPQSKFEGSARQARGALLKALAEGSKDASFLMSLLGVSRRDQMKAQLIALLKEGMVELRGNRFRLPS
jgi:A/G-specific adenine glycosylase